MGTLAGSTLMLLSIAWGGSLAVGRCDLDARGQAKDRTLTRCFDHISQGWDRPCR